MTLINNTIVKTMVLWCSIVISLFSQYPSVSLMTKNILDSQKMTEVETFVKELYEAQTNKDVNWIRERLDDDVIDWAVKLSTLYSDDFGFRKYDNIEVKAYAISSEDYFVACVAYDVVIEWKGEVLALPGIETYNYSVIRGEAQSRTVGYFGDSWGK